MRISRRAVAMMAVLVGLVACASMWPIARAAFLNWDDDAVFVRNAALTSDRVVAWAFTTTHMGHYQPLSWIVWSFVARTFGVSSSPFHILNLVTHGIATGLVFVLAIRLLVLARAPENPVGRPFQGRRESRTWIAGAAGALLFGVHPMRVEPVAWASAFPYLAALLFAVLATFAYVASRTAPWTNGRWRRPTFGALGWSVAAVASFAVSLGFRPIAVGLPLILLLLDWYPLRAAHRKAGRDRSIPLLVDKIPYALIALVAVGLEWFARRQVGFNELSTAARLTLAATSPLVYLWRTVAPFGLSPVPVLALNAQGSVVGIISATLIGAVLAVGWGLRDRRPAVLALSVAYLLLVAPAAGLAPTGLQVIADRYAYLPAVALAVGAAAAIGSVEWNRRLVLATTGTALVGLSVLAWKQTLVWQDSVALWTRASQLDPQNDVAFYNLGSALQDVGRSDEAMAAYEATLRLVPDHVPARRNLSGLQAIARQRQADALASSGNLAAAIPLYRETLTLDPRRARARAALGVALARTGRFEEAAQELARAMEQGVDDPAVINAAGFSLMQTGRTDDAVRLLRAAQARHPEDANIAHNLELLLNQR